MDEKDFELAAKIAEADIERGISRTRSDAAPPVDWDGRSCFVCGDDIPQPRLDLGRFTCMHCQARKERLAKLQRP
jgi:RNA polymerase-binding transcription factor DksA